ncbi:sugar ABC transporter ATP-binding protein [Streptomyces coeruleorubidus]|uniref:Sugar ABC transporter ATP-binding protein n=1 Tax=Streptomyces coeruleorubidus TaxID=116188 RepID=A0A5J6HWF3_STRC4|nr:sugar ABC transporter ATP-binding protein [Streptomyces coeruleorubidus]QEV23164.1 sugar ABC transporter ATP-binding protein [Streptomyces coeruleorubidus]GGT80730.1 sugar ABC transporter [Streptomyces coeruleorubidus]
MTNVSQVTRDQAHEGLVVRGVSKRFGATQALDRIDFDVRPGEVVALLGENGAGKSTIGNIIAGTFPSDTGHMTWQGRPYEPKSPGDAITHGIGLIHQETRLLPDLSIAENVFLGRLLTRAGRIDRTEMNRRAEEQLHRLGLDISPTRLVGTLRVAAQQQVEIAKALTLNARLLILDEPTAALGGDETDHLFERIDALRKEGVSFIYVSHRLEEIARICDRIVVMRDGQRVATHATAQVPVSQLVEEMVGRSVDRLFPDPGVPTEREVLRVEGLSNPSFRDVSFSVRAGEVFGIAGIVGAGRTEVVRAIAGVDPVTEGKVSVDGRVLRLRGPRDAIEAGVALVPEDRKGQGAVLDLSIGDNVVLPSLGRVARQGWLTPQRVTEVATDAIKMMTVKGRAAQPVRTLSGGNQQKVVIAKWLERKPKVIILDEPTRGIDVGARAAIYEVIANLARSGMAVVVVSSDLDEVLGLSHRVLVLSRGRQQGILPAEEATNSAVMHLATA